MRQALFVLSRLVGTGAVMAAILTGFFLFLYLLYRLILLVRWLRKPPEERRALRARKAAAARHPLSRLSGRDRTAYLILCLERALEAYSQAPGDWPWVLERLRALLEETADPDPFYRAAALLPFNVLPYERWDPRTFDAIYDDLMDLWDPDRGEDYLSGERFQFLRELYLREGWRMSVFAPLLLAVYDQAYFCRENGGAPLPAAMEILDQALALLYCWNIPLPRVEEL